MIDNSVYFLGMSDRVRARGTEAVAATVMVEYEGRQQQQAIWQQTTTLNLAAKNVSQRSSRHEGSHVFVGAIS